MNMQRLILGAVCALILTAATVPVSAQTTVTVYKSEGTWVFWTTCSGMTDDDCAFYVWEEYFAHDPEWQPDAICEDAGHVSSAYGAYKLWGVNIGGVPPLITFDFGVAVECIPNSCPPTGPCDT